MNDDLSQELRAFEGSEALENGDFSVCIRGADRIEAQAKRIKELEYLLMLIKNVKSGPFYFDGQEYQITFYQN